MRAPLKVSAYAMFGVSAQTTEESDTIGLNQYLVLRDQYLVLRATESRQISADYTIGAMPFGF
jgi:hypothetical protein